jgi:PAS domain S-box-containing protein
MEILANILLTGFLRGSVDAVSVVLTLLAIIVFAICWALNRISILRIRKNTRRAREISTVMKQTLNLSGDYVLRLSLADRLAHNLQGDFLPENGMTFEESRDYMHPDDWPLYVEFLRTLMSGKQKKAECNFRWNAGTRDKPEWRNMHDQAIAEYANERVHTPTNIFSILTDKTEFLIQEKEEQLLNEKYRRVYEQSIVGLAFYDKDGNLMTTNPKMREILKFQSEDDPFYYNSTIYDMPDFRDVINRRKIEELWFCTKSVIVERGVNCYTELRLHPIYDEHDELVYITFSIRDITQERELYLKNKRNDAEIRSRSQAIQQYEQELQYLMESCDMRFWRASFANRTITFHKGLSTAEREMTFDELAEQFFDEELRAYYKNPENVERVGAMTRLCKTRPFFHEGREYQWNIFDSVPYRNEAGELTGTYGLIRNVTPLIEKQEQLRRETERANESGHMKSVFMANMTHEIRTPLNSIVGFSDVLPMMTTPEEKQEIVKVIMNNCDMLLRLINDILAVSTLDSDGIKIMKQEVDFAKTFDEICLSLTERVQTPGVEFIKDNPYETLKAKLDPGRIQQVITNFVTNAVKYTQQGHIKVGYRKEDNGLYIYCEDTGAGIPKEAQQKVFERFVKLNDYVQGTGLGLAISKAIVERCNGRIGVNSEGEGKGSTFWMWVPCE